MSAQTLTLAAFLAARLDEDREAAHQALLYRGSGTTYPLGHPCDPGRVLAEVASKRAVVQALNTCLDPSDEDRERLATEHPKAAQYAPSEWYDGQRWGLAEAVRELAAVYSDHPDYDERWRP